VIEHTQRVAVIEAQRERFWSGYFGPYNRTIKKNVYPVRLALRRLHLVIDNCPVGRNEFPITFDAYSSRLLCGKPKMNYERS
jgi:hypothetical protein